MAIEFKDYYAVLGVARTATGPEIKQAFRALARRFHPDVAKDKATAEAKFKEINEANEVLSDPDKRRKYDEWGANWEHPEREAPPPGAGFAADPRMGDEFHFEGTGFSDFFEQLFGNRGRPMEGEARRGRPRTASARQGQDIEGDILVTLAEVVHGSTRTIQLQRTDPRTGASTVQTLQVRIPPGVRAAQLIRLSGKGQEGAGGGAAGHLYLRVRFAQHPDFQVHGADLHMELELAPWEAVLGATVRLPTLVGTVALKIPPGTMAGRQFRLRGKGLPTGKAGVGDLYAVVSIHVPPRPTAAELALWEQLAAIATFNPRSSP